MPPWRQAFCPPPTHRKTIPGRHFSGRRERALWMRPKCLTSDRSWPARSAAGTRRSHGSGDTLDVLRILRYATSCGRRHPAGAMAPAALRHVRHPTAGAASHGAPPGLADGAHRQRLQAPADFSAPAYTCCTAVSFQQGPPAPDRSAPSAWGRGKGQRRTSGRRSIHCHPDRRAGIALYSFRPRRDARREPHACRAGPGPVRSFAGRRWR
jgi:hypothetical protein